MNFELNIYASDETDNQVENNKELPLQKIFSWNIIELK